MGVLLSQKFKQCDGWKEKIQSINNTTSINNTMSLLHFCHANIEAKQITEKIHKHSCMKGFSLYVKNFVFFFELWRVRKGENNFNRKQQMRVEYSTSYEIMIIWIDLSTLMIMIAYDICTFVCFIQLNRIIYFSDFLVKQKKEIWKSTAHC